MPAYPYCEPADAPSKEPLQAKSSGVINKEALSTQIRASIDVKVELPYSAEKMTSPGLVISPAALNNQDV